MRILLSTEDLIELVTKHAFTSLVPTAKAADVEVGILDGQIVAAVAVGEDNFRLNSVTDLQAPLVSGGTPVAEQEEEEDHDDDTQEEQETDKPVKRRKRRTKAEIEADKAAEEAKDAAVAEEVDPFADAGLASSEGDELFAQADTPVTKVVETSEAGFAKPADTEDDPFANFD